MTVQTNDFNQVMMRSITNDMGIPDPTKWDIHEMLKKYSYAFLVMYVLDKVGITRQSEIIKVIAEIQKDLDHIITDMNLLKQLFQKLEGLDWGYEMDKTTGQPKIDPTTGEKIPYDPSKHTDDENMTHLKETGIIDKWLYDRTAKDPYTGKTCSNYDAMKSIWKDLFGEDGEGGWKGKLETDLKNTTYSQWDDSQSMFQLLKSLDTIDIMSGHADDWSSGGFSLLDVLQGKDISNDDLIHIFSRVYANNSYSKTGWEPYKEGSTTEHETKQWNANIEDLRTLFETDKGTFNSLNTTEAADLSMYSQNLTSEIQQGQQIIQYYSQETKTYVSNFIARG